MLARLRGVSALLSILQREWDTAASKPMEGIARYGDIVRRGSLLAGDDLRQRLGRTLEAIAVDASDYRISALEGKLDQLREAVIDLQAWLEDEGGPKHERFSLTYGGRSTTMPWPRTGTCRCGSDIAASSMRRRRDGRAPDQAVFRSWNVRR